MVKKIKKRTKAQTPAPPKDRIKGSAKNPKGSASSSRGDIKISESTEKALKNLKDKHNDKYTAKSKQVDMGKLKAAYRRGAGAFSTSHRPTVSSREQWALARVKAFLKLVGTGERKKAYTADLDLLPTGHPQKPTEAKTEFLSPPDKYSHIDFKPPKSAQESAKRALDKRADKPPSQRGMTAIGIARARDLANGKTLSPDTARRVLAYFTRHEVDKKGSTWKDYGKGRQAWDGWGGDAGYTWSRKVVNQMNKADNKLKSLKAYGEAIQLKEYELSSKELDGLHLGKPFKTLSLGQVSSRMNGEKIGREINHDLLQEIVRVFNERYSEDPVIIDWQHATSPFNGGPPAPPSSGNALGLIVELDLRDDGLYAVPAYNEKGVEVVKSAGGVLWSSPEYIDGDVYSREDGSKIGDAQLLAITLTPRPAQSHNKLQRVTLSESIKDNKMDDRLEDMGLEAAKAMIQELQKQIADMKAEKSASLVKSTEEDDKDKKLAEEDDKDKKLAEEDDKDKKLAEEDDKDKKMAEEDKDKYKKLSESAPTLLSEINMLKEQARKQDRIITKLAEENNAIKCNEAVSILLSEGKISPAEEKYARDAWNIRELQPTWWESFKVRPTNSHVNLSEVGHASSGAEINKKSLDAKVKAVAKDKSVTYSEALNIVRNDDPSFYLKAYGV